MSIFPTFPVQYSIKVIDYRLYTSIDRQRMTFDILLFVDVFVIF